ncbi:MAG: MltA domain-containing protein [Thiothrix sp.]
MLTSLFKHLLATSCLTLGTSALCAESLLPVTTTAQPHISHLVSTASTTSCLTNSPALRASLNDLAVYLRTTPATRLAAPDYNGPLDIPRLQRTVMQLLRWLDNPSVPLEQQFDLYALGDPRSQQPVKYSGYYTPLLEVSDRPDSEFRYPIYQMPAGKGALPTRAEIMRGALHGKGLEIAWTNNPVDYYFMQVQGSGVMRFRDGHTQLLGFAGKNGHPYISIGQYMQQQGYLRGNDLSNEAVRQWLNLNPNKRDEILAANPAFVFFKVLQDNIRGAAGLPVVAGHTASVDTSMIPFGSILLAELAWRDPNGTTLQREWRLLLATDRRPEDKSVVSIGIYTGEGAQAQNDAQRLVSTGRAFILQSAQ